MGAPTPVDVEWNEMVTSCYKLKQYHESTVTQASSLRSLTSSESSWGWVDHAQSGGVLKTALQAVEASAT